MSKIRLNRGVGLNIPINITNTFDITGQEQMIEKFSEDTLQQIINPVKDYEVAKFIHDYDDYGINNLYFSMHFIGEGDLWFNDYGPQGFDISELVSFTDPVKNSFFKLDFFDSPNRETQKLQFTKIIPVYLSTQVLLGEVVDGMSTYIVPSFYSNSLDNSEIGNLYIFRNTDTKNIDEFYMSCRFFNAKDGNVVRMINDDISDMGINPNRDYYYKVIINRQKNTYLIYSLVDGVIGDVVGNEENNPVKFYQMA